MLAKTSGIHTEPHFCLYLPADVGGEHLWPVSPHQHTGVPQVLAAMAKLDIHLEHDTLGTGEAALKIDTQHHLSTRHPLSHVNNVNSAACVRASEHDQALHDIQQVMSCIGCGSLVQGQRMITEYYAHSFRRIRRKKFYQQDLRRLS